MSDREELYQKASDILEEIEGLVADLNTERSLRKVWGGVGVLLFVYGLVYGVYLSK